MTVEPFPLDKSDELLGALLDELRRAAKRPDIHGVSNRWKAGLEADVAFVQANTNQILKALSEQRGKKIDLHMLGGAARAHRIWDHVVSEFIYAAMIEAIVSRLRGLADPNNVDYLPPTISAK